MALNIQHMIRYAIAFTLLGLGAFLVGLALEMARFSLTLHR